MKIIFSLMLALLVAGCAGTGGRGPSDEQRVGERAQLRWDLLLAGDLDAAYGFLSPAQRSAISSLDYQRSVLQSKVRWTAAKYLDAECEPETCRVQVEIGMTIFAAIPGVSRYDLEQVIDEQWVKVDGEWWFVPQ